MSMLGNFILEKQKNFMRKKSLHYSGSSKGMIIPSEHALDVNTNKIGKT